MHMKPRHFPARPFNRDADWPTWLTDEEKQYGHSGMYRFYDSERSLLYTGISNSMQVRWMNHRCTAKWWRQASFVAVSYFPDGCGVRADMAEKASIAHERPPFNINHKDPGRAVAEGLLPFLPPPAQFAD